MTLATRQRIFPDRNFSFTEKSRPAIPLPEPEKSGNVISEGKSNGRLPVCREGNAQQGLDLDLGYSGRSEKVPPWEHERIRLPFGVTGKRDFQREGRDFPASPGIRRRTDVLH